MAVWTTAYINDLPNSSFAHIEPGQKDEEGKTKLRGLRHLPYKDEKGNIDLAHLRNALARLVQTHIPEKAKALARAVLVKAAKKAGIEVTECIKESKEVTEQAETKLVIEGIFGEGQVDREKKIIRNVSILGLRSPNAGGRDYSDQALDSAIKIFESAPAYYNHKKGSRDVRELAGEFRNLSRDSQRVRGDLHVLERESWLLDLAERFPQRAGASIDATVSYRKKAGGGEVIESIVSGRSVDLVTDPATVKGLFESLDSKSKGGSDMDIKELQEKLLAEQVETKDLKEKLDQEQMDKKKLQEDFKKIQEEVKKLQDAKAGEERKSLIETKTKDLPEWAVTDVFKKQLTEAKDDKVIDELIADRKALSEKKKYERIPAGLGKKSVSEGKAAEVDDIEMKAALRG